MQLLAAQTLEETRDQSPSQYERRFVQEYRGRIAYETYCDRMESCRDVELPRWPILSVLEQCAWTEVATAIAKLHEPEGELVPDQEDDV